VEHGLGDTDPDRGPASTPTMSERQWADVIGVLRAGGARDEAYLQGGAAELGVADLLERARADVGRHPA